MRRLFMDALKEFGFFMQPARRKCLHLYFYFMDGDFGLIHARIQTWFPHADPGVSQMGTSGSLGSCRPITSAIPSTTTSFSGSRTWPSADAGHSPRPPRLMGERSKQVLDDILFKTRQDLCELYPQLLSHGTLCFGAREAMNFLGRKLHGKSKARSSPISRASSAAARVDPESPVSKRTGSRCIASRVSFFGWKPSTIPRNSGYARRSRATASVKPNGLRCAKGSPTYSATVRSPSKPTAVISMRCGGRGSNQRETGSRPCHHSQKDAAGRGCSGFNPLARHDAELFMAGEHCLRGFTNHDIRARLASSVHLRTCRQDPKKESAKVSRTLRRFHALSLIAKIPRTRRWRVTLYGRRVMSTSLYLRDHDFPKAYSVIAA